MKTFQITLGETYYNNGYFNIPIEYDEFISDQSEKITLVLGEQKEVSAKVTRLTNQPITRIFGRKALKNWFQANFKLNDTLDITIKSPEKLIFQPSLSSEIVADIVETVLNQVRQAFPGWNSFQHIPFVEDEVNYKRKTVEKAASLLGENELSRLLNDESFDEILDRIKKVGSDNNLLWRGVPKSGDLNILTAIEAQKSTFCHAFFDLIYGEGQTNMRLGRYLNFIEQNNLPNKWTFPTYFLFVLLPTQELFIKPSTIQNFLAIIGQKARFSSKPSTRSYQSIKEVAETLYRELESYHPQDMIDIQSLMWVVVAQSTVTKKPIRYWKIAPGENAMYWDEWRDGNFIAIDWSEIGDVSNMSRAEFDARCQQVLAKHPDWSRQGMAQVWKFAKDIKP